MSNKCKLLNFLHQYPSFNTFALFLQTLKHIDSPILALCSAPFYLIGLGKCIVIHTKDDKIFSSFSAWLYLDEWGFRFRILCFTAYIPPLYLPKKALQFGHLCSTWFKSSMQHGIQAQHQNLKIKKNEIQAYLIEFDKKFTLLS